MKNHNHNYESDFYAWVLHNAKLIRKGRLSEIDAEHVAEELESMGRSEKRELESRLAQLIAHLLKWLYQPVRQSKSWIYTIKDQRWELAKLLKDSPSLKANLQSAFQDTYKHAVTLTAKQTGIDENKFPKKCPFSLAECLDFDFLPEDK